MEVLNMTQLGTTEDEAHQRPFPFMRLPPELRIMVYKEIAIYSFHRIATLESSKEPTSTTSTTEIIEPTPPPKLKLLTYGLTIQLLATSREIHAEAAPILLPKREQIRQLVPRMIVEITADAFPPEIGGIIQSIGRWHEALRDNLLETRQNYNRKNSNTSFADFAKLRPKYSPAMLRYIHQAGIQLFRRWNNIRQGRRDEAAQENAFAVQFHVTDALAGSHTPTCPYEWEELETQVGVVNMIVGEAFLARMLPGSLFSNQRVVFACKSKCLHPDLAWRTIWYAWVPGPGQWRARTEEEVTKAKFETRCSWVENCEVEVL